ncbi:MAG: hypothetical protein ACK4OM_06575 [Alphaproteobacteria bacterium]
MANNTKNSFPKEIAESYWSMRMIEDYDAAKQLFVKYKNITGNIPQEVGGISIKGGYGGAILIAPTTIRLEDNVKIDSSFSVLLEAIDIICANSSIVSTEAVYLNGESIALYNTTITAPDIYLPPQDHVLSTNTQLIGNVHYLTPEQFDNI